MALGAAPIRVVIFHGLAIEAMRVMQEEVQLRFIALPERCPTPIADLGQAILGNINDLLGHSKKGQ